MASEERMLERSFYLGNVLGGVMYGIQVYLTIHTLHCLFTARTRKGDGRVFYAAFGVVMLICMTFAEAANFTLGQKMWIENRDYPGGPLIWFFENSTVWYNILGSAFDLFGNFMGDALLIYRCYVIWNCDLRIIVFPVILYLASTGMAILSLYQSAVPGSSFFVSATISYAVPWIALTTGLNFIVTVLIASRILWLKKQVRAVLPPDAAKVYTSIVAIMVESALPFTILGIAFAALLGKGNVANLAFSCIWGYYVGIAPMLIILRVAMGRAWTKETAAQVTGSVVFASRPDMTSISTNQQTLDSTGSTAVGNRLGDTSSKKSQTTFSDSV